MTATVPGRANVGGFGRRRTQFPVSRLLAPELFSGGRRLLSGVVSLQIRNVVSADEEPRLAEDPYTKEINVRNLMCIPVHDAKNEIIGACLMLNKQLRNFTELDLDRVQVCIYSEGLTEVSDIQIKTAKN